MSVLEGKTSENPIKHRFSLYVSDADALLIKTWYKYEVQAVNVEERMCFMQFVPKDEIPSFMKGRRLDRVIEVRGGNGAFALPNSFNLIIMKDGKFSEGGVARNKGAVKTTRNKDKLFNVGTISVTNQDDILSEMIGQLDVNCHIKPKEKKDVKKDNKRPEKDRKVPKLFGSSGVPELSKLYFVAIEKQSAYALNEKGQVYATFIVLGNAAKFTR